MSNLKKICLRHPVIFSIIIYFIFIYLTELRLDKFFTGYMDKQSASYLNGIVTQGVAALVILIIVDGLGLFKISRITGPGKWKQVWLAWPILILSVLNGWSVFGGAEKVDTSSPGLLILFVLVYISTGLFEEFLGRGLIMTIMLHKWGKTKKGIYSAVLLSGLLFGLFHLINLIMGRSTFIFVAAQVGYALFFGVFFAALMLRCNSIWIPVAAHAVFDICGNFNEVIINGSFGRLQETTPSNAMLVLLLTLPLLLYGLFILRKMEPLTENGGAGSAK